MLTARRHLLIASLLGLPVLPISGPPAAGLAAPSTVPAAGGVLGRWKTIDDETGRPKAVVELREDRGEVSGRIVELIDPPVADPVCEACEGTRRGQPIKGMLILWGLRPEGPSIWGGGHILDPKKGKEYSCSVQLIENGGKLRVRGYVGISLLGRTQTWLRAP